VSETLEPVREVLVVQQWRFEQARDAGLTKLEARLFAESEASLETLRKLQRLGCPPQKIAAIVL